MQSLIIFIITEFIKFRYLVQLMYCELIWLNTHFKLAAELLLKVLLIKLISHTKFVCEQILSEARVRLTQYSFVPTDPFPTDVAIADGSMSFS